MKITKPSDPSTLMVVRLIEAPEAEDARFSIRLRRKADGATLTKSLTAREMLDMMEANQRAFRDYSQRLLVAKMKELGVSFAKREKGRCVLCGDKVSAKAIDRHILHCALDRAINGDKTTQAVLRSWGRRSKAVS